jgi:tetratricopeptide (TPR) repeat protein
MRIFFLALSLAILLQPSGTLRAGLYRTSEPAIGPTVAEDGAKPLGFSQFRDVLTGLLQLGIEKPESPDRKRYLAERDRLQMKARSGNLSIEESINLSEDFIRLRQYEEAVELLTRTVAQDRRNFMAFANLATAHQLAGRTERGISYLQQALDVWPQQWSGFSAQQLKWLRQVEGYQLKLWRLRYREAAAGRTKQPTGLDNLFDSAKGPVRFLGAQGQYEPGGLAAEERAKLPADALPIVQQLLIWLPEDTRLYWLLGELYNANGDIDAAAKIFEDCVWSRRFDAAELREHRKLVQAVPQKSEPLLSNDLGRPVTTAPAKSNDRWLPGGRQTIIVVGIAVLLVGTLAYFQIREVRKRRKAL